jgi:pathogenesis-related protein 1
VALAYAMKCMWQHNPNAAAEYMALGGKSGLGEDIAAGAPTQTIDGAVTGWIAERANYDHATNSCASGKVCGHYTQIVWSTTTAVGCAQVSCTTNSPFGSFANGLWDFEVCDFSPPGNIGSLSPY